jgi:hypothetical protein
VVFRAHGVREIPGLSPPPVNAGELPGRRTVGLRTVTEPVPGETPLSNQPPDPLGPFNPPQPYGPPASGPPGEPAHPVSADPWSYPSGDPSGDPLAPTPPAYQPGYAAPPPPGPYQPTAQYDAAPHYGPPGPGAPAGYPPAGPPPRKSNTPLIALILAVTVLLCGGAVTAGVLVVNNVADRAKEAIEPITDPTLPAVPTEVPDLPTEIPDLPTAVPTLPTDLPDLPGTSNKTISVVYEVTGDGPAEILYTEKLGESPKRVSNARLPWRLKTSMKGAALVSVTAIRNATENGTISCRATVDGKEVAQRTREGSFATASCIKMVLD